MVGQKRRQDCRCREERWDPLTGFFFTRRVLLRHARAAALLGGSSNLTLTDLQALQCKGKWCWRSLLNVGYTRGNNSLKCMFLLKY